MLASRTALGKFLFSDASITLHSVTGGDVDENQMNVEELEISDIVTRWSLRMTVSILPWKPTARFTGISVYKVQVNKDNDNDNNNNNNKDNDNDSFNLKIVNQVDYWDSINIVPNSSGEYKTVDVGIAINDFLNQLKPSGFQAQSAAPELPYQLLRRGDGYEGAYCVLCIAYYVLGFTYYVTCENDKNEEREGKREIYISKELEREKVISN